MRDKSLVSSTAAQNVSEQTALESLFDNAATNAHSVIRVRDSGAAIHNKKADSRKDYSASAECMDCHADKSARNDRKNAASKKVDSSFSTHNAANIMDCHDSATAESRNDDKKVDSSRSQ